MEINAWAHEHFNKSLSVNTVLCQHPQMQDKALSWEKESICEHDPETHLKCTELETVLCYVYRLLLKEDGCFWV